MQTILWCLGRADGVAILGALWRPFLIGLVLYYSNYLYVWCASLVRSAGLRPFRPLARDEQVDVLIVIPTLLRSRDELDELCAASRTVIANGYPGRVVLCLAIDGSADHRALVAELEAWAGGQRGPVAVLVAHYPRRAGKGVAVAAGLARAKDAVQRGEIAALPPVFFNMDADGVLGPRALERMVATLIRPGRWTRQRPMIVASNVLVRHEHAWHGWRGYVTLRSQLALQVAREYLTSISISRNNRGLLPVTGVSGALYCTWTELHELQPRYASFLLRLRIRDVLAWWLGASPPSFARFDGPPNDAATAGPGDDTWIAWLAISARWRGPRIDLELPRSPLHALGRLLGSYLVRPIAYDPLARIYTATPTTIRALFKQRVRWNCSRWWLLQRFGAMPYFAWHLGAWVILDVIFVISIHVTILIGLVGWPFAERSATWLAVVALGAVGVLAIRGAATLLAMVQDHDVIGHRHKLLALPLSGVYHVVFNIVPTIVGFVHDYLLFGLNTGFAPEETLQASSTGRVALGYRLCRCFKLARRAIRHGDVPVGRFWLGWGATRWTANGYAGWTNPANRIGRGGVLPHVPAGGRRAGAPGALSR
jgi:glycosyltransferase involved in cell wall biosynthesis